jgi:hypothetical protein
MKGCLKSGIGVAQLRLANLVQGDWLSGASQVGYQGGIDHLMQAERFDDLPGTSRLVGSSSWIRCVPGPRRSRHPRHREILAFQHDPTWFFGFMGCWVSPAVTTADSVQSIFSTIKSRR